MVVDVLKVTFGEPAIVRGSTKFETRRRVPTHAVGVRADEGAGVQDSEGARARLRLLRRLESYTDQAMKHEEANERWHTIAILLWSSISKSRALGKDKGTFLRACGQTVQGLSPMRGKRRLSDG